MKFNKILFMFLITLFFSFILENVNANTIKSIDIDVFIDEKGNGKVTEIWEADLNKGTEGYRPYSKNMDDKYITDFVVRDDSGRIYENVSYWNINDSFNEKAYKSAIKNVYNGVELCWGISEYGKRTYTLNYTINNLVTQYTDTQGIDFNFLNLDQKINSATVTIHSDIPFSLNNAKIWNFGNNGTIVFEDGKIVNSIKKGLNIGQYTTILVRFEENIFNIENKSLKSFDNAYDEVFKNVSVKEKEITTPSFGERMKKIIDEIWYIIKLILTWPFTYVFGLVFGSEIVVNKAIKRKEKQSEEYDSLDFGPEGKKLPDIDDIEYFREIPCDKDVERAYWVLSKYKIVTDKTLKKGIIGAILLRWLKNEYITIKPAEKKSIIKKDNNYNIDLNKICDVKLNKIETNLLSFMLDASGKNKILEGKEFLKWSKKNYYSLDHWYSRIVINEQEQLQNQGLISAEVKKKANDKIVDRVVSKQLREDALQLKGLKKFLEDFTLIDEKQHIEVHIWEEYLILAELMGIADKVSKQFKKIYPDLKAPFEFDDIDIGEYTRDFSGNCYEKTKTKVAASERKPRLFTGGSDRDYSGSDRLSGGGGSSFSSGGSSSGGSSGGGFR